MRQSSNRVQKQIAINLRCKYNFSNQISKDFGPNQYLKCYLNLGIEIRTYSDTVEFSLLFGLDPMLKFKWDCL